MVLQTVRVVLGAMFILSGSLKNKHIGKAVFPEQHKELAKQFSRMNKVSPLKELYPMKPSEYRELVGYIEIICGFMLLTGILEDIAIVILIIEMIVAIYTHTMLNDGIMRSSVLHFSILTTLIVVLFFGNRRETKVKRQ